VPVGDELIHDIEAVLGSVAPDITTATALWDTFEVYVFSLVVDAARRAGGAVAYRNVTTPFNGTFTFRTGPGSIYSTAHPYTHARIQFPNCDLLEAHVGIYASGVSGVRHECDVAALSFDEAENCRRQQVHPRCSELVISAECKFYSSNLDVDLGRSFLGLVKEIHQRDRFFVTNSGAASLERMLAHHKIRWQHQIVPANADLVNRLRASFEEVFQNYQALH
jgi:hypothetical protein